MSQEKSAFKILQEIVARWKYELTASTEQLLERGVYGPEHRRWVEEGFRFLTTDNFPVTKAKAEKMKRKAAKLYEQSVGVRVVEVRIHYVAYDESGRRESGRVSIWGKPHIE